LGGGNGVASFHPQTTRVPFFLPPPLQENEIEKKAAGVIAGPSPLIFPTVGKTSGALSSWTPVFLSHAGALEGVSTLLLFLLPLRSQKKGKRKSFGGCFPSTSFPPPEADPCLRNARTKQSRFFPLPPFFVFVAKGGEEKHTKDLFFPLSSAWEGIAGGAFLFSLFFFYQDF